MLSIRSATASDVAVLSTMIHEMARYERLPLSMTQEQLASDGFGPKPQFRVILAEWDGEPAGYAFFFNSYSTFRGRGLFLEDLYVRSEFRRRKIGDALLAQVAKVALLENCFGLMLNVLEWNRPAIEFFRRHGVKFLDDWKTGSLEGQAFRALAT